MVTKFNSGAIRDTQEGKNDFVETITYTGLDKFATYMTGKKKKYGEGNFKKGIDIESYEKSLIRHWVKYMKNKYEGGQDEPDEDHISAIIFNAFGILHEQERNKNFTRLTPEEKRKIVEDLLVNK